MHTLKKDVLPDNLNACVTLARHSNKLYMQTELGVLQINGVARN